MKLLLPLLALSTTTLSAPTRNGVTIKYTANYPDPPAPHSQRSAPNELPEDAHEEDVPSPTNVADPSLLGGDLDEILSLEKPLPTSFLMAVPELRAKRLRDAVSETEAEKEKGEGQEQGEVPAAEESRRAPQARDVDEPNVNWASDMGHACPFAAVMAVSVVALLACAIQRYVPSIPPPASHPALLHVPSVRNQANRKQLEETPRRDLPPRREAPALPLAPRRGNGFNGVGVASPRPYPDIRAPGHFCVRKSESFAAHIPAFGYSSDFFCIFWFWVDL